VLVLVTKSQDESGLVVDGDGRATLLVIISAFPVLQMTALLVSEEAEAIDHQQLAAVLLGVREVNVKCCE